MSDTPSSETAAPIEDVAPAESVAAAPEAGAPVPAVAVSLSAVPYGATTLQSVTTVPASMYAAVAPQPPAAPVRPENGSLHDIIAWLEAKVAWLESKF